MMPMGTNTYHDVRDVTAAPAILRLRCTVNGRTVERDVSVDRPLLAFLRDDLGLTGTKGSCLEGECGSCTVLLDGVPINSCMSLAGQCRGRDITTIEGLAGDDGLAILQEKFIDAGAAQCGYCTPGLIMAAHALLQENAELTEDQLLTAVEANLCRCTGYASIVEAIRSAHREMQP